MSQLSPSCLPDVVCCCLPVAFKVSPLSSCLPLVSQMWSQNRLPVVSQLSPKCFPKVVSCFSQLFSTCPQRQLSLALALKPSLLLSCKAGLMLIYSQFSTNLASQQSPPAPRLQSALNHSRPKGCDVLRPIRRLEACGQTHQIQLTMS